MNFYTSELAAYWQGAVPWFWSWAGRAKEKHPGDEVANLRMQESLSEEKKPSLYLLPYLQQMIAMVSHRELQFWQF